MSDMYAFASGKEYARQHLLNFVGSRQAQSGVIWGPKEPGCIICTSGGRHGNKAGYFDESLPDGNWWYFGQGTDGDQKLTNSANSKLAAQQRSVLLFTTREPTSKEIAAQGGYGKLFKYRGVFNVAGHEIHVPTTGKRAGNQLIRFLLVPSEESHEAHESAIPQGLQEGLVQQWLRRATSEPAPIGLSLVNYRKRCLQITIYARLRACGMCEGCGMEAPFIDQDGTPFLEVHHLVRLADDGPDTPKNVAALCPNCHRRAHHGSDRFEFNKKISSSILAIEATLK